MASLFFLGLLISVPTVTQAQLNADTNLGLSYGAETGLSSTDVRTITAKVINVSLGLLGTIALVIILIAGFKWMTAGGDTAAVDKAREWMKAGVIGLAIILAAYSIAAFVVKNLVTATND